MQVDNEEVWLLLPLQDRSWSLLGLTLTESTVSSDDKYKLYVGFLLPSTPLVWILIYQSRKELTPNSARNDPAERFGIHLMTVLQADRKMSRVCRIAFDRKYWACAQDDNKSNLAKEAELTRWPMQQIYHGSWQLWSSLRLFQCLSRSRRLPLSSWYHRGLSHVHNYHLCERRGRPLLILPSLTHTLVFLSTDSRGS